MRRVWLFLSSCRCSSRVSSASESWNQWLHLSAPQLSYLTNKEAAEVTSGVLAGCISVFH